MIDNVGGMQRMYKHIQTTLASQACLINLFGSMQWNDASSNFEFTRCGDQRISHLLHVQTSVFTA